MNLSLYGRYEWDLKKQLGFMALAFGESTEKLARRHIYNETCAFDIVNYSIQLPPNSNSFKTH